MSSSINFSNILPIVLYSKCLSYLNDIQDLLHIAVACKTFHTVIQTEPIAWSFSTMNAWCNPLQASKWKSASTPYLRILVAESEAQIQWRVLDCSSLYYLRILNIPNLDLDTSIDPFPFNSNNTPFLQVFAHHCSKIGC